MKFLEHAHERLGKGFLASIRAFSKLIEMRAGSVLTGHVARVADHARNLAQRLGMKEPELQDVVFVALLRDFGKLSLPDRLLAKSRVHAGCRRTRVAGETPDNDVLDDVTIAQLRTYEKTMSIGLSVSFVIGKGG